MMSGKTKLAGIMGYPVAHSRSPLLHNSWLQHYGIDGAYAPLPVKPAQLEKALRGLSALGFAGCNVTVPHKEKALALMDHVDALAKKVGAVNTVLVRDDGSLEGRNTDVFGFTCNVEDAAQKNNNSSWQKKKPALVVGAGGAARAVLVALVEAGCKTIYLTNRTSERAKALAAEMNGFAGEAIKILGWPDRAEVLPEIYLLANTTTQGMEGHDRLELDLKTLNPEALVTDLVYTPLHTPLLLEAKRRQHEVVDGLGMLLYQAIPGFAAWFGKTPEVTPELRARIEASLKGG